MISSVLSRNLLGADDIPAEPQFMAQKHLGIRTLKTAKADQSNFSHSRRMAAGSIGPIETMRCVCGVTSWAES